MPKHLEPQLAHSETALEYFLECLKGTGDQSLSRRMTGISTDDLKILAVRFPEKYAEISEAEMYGKEERLKQGLELLKKSHSVSMICENVKDMLEVAKILAPEVAVYPIERERARAKAEHATPSNQIQLNVALSDLAGRLQQALKP